MVTKPNWQIFFQMIQQDFKLFLFLWFLFSFLRIAFIGVMHTALSSTNSLEVLQAVYYGARISLKSAGALAFLSFLFITLPGLFFFSKHVDKYRRVYSLLVIFTLVLLFQIRIPYYEAFHAAFDQFLFNTLKDDVSALTITIIQQYPVMQYVLSLLLLTFFFDWLCRKWLGTKAFNWPQFSSKVWNSLARLLLVLFILTFMVFARFGGSLTYAKSIHWENAAMLKSDLLNEAILDDIQALYRAYASYERVKEAMGPALKMENVEAAAKWLSDQPKQNQSIQQALSHKAQGPLIPKPKHIFIVLGETYAQWPLLEDYDSLHLADEIKDLLQRDNCLWLRNFIPASSGTIGAVNTVVTGLAEVNQYPNYQPKSYKEQYITSLAPQFKRLGYRTVFWYGGFGSWQKIRDFALAQGFDQFYSYSDLPEQKGNAWGTEDKYLFEAIAKAVNEEEPTVHVILTVSNHPPYTVNVDEEGFPRGLVRDALPENLKNRKETLDALGHIWYAHHTTRKFIDQVIEKNPESLFVLTADHANRFNLEDNPTLFVRQSIPFILYGSGVRKNLISSESAGQQINIFPTLMELIAPKDFVYYSIGKSLTRSNDWAANHEIWEEKGSIGLLQGKEASDKIKNFSESQRILSSWLIQSDIDGK